MRPPWKAPWEAVPAGAEARSGAAAPSSACWAAASCAPAVRQSACDGAASRRERGARTAYRARSSRSESRAAPCLPATNRATPTINFPCEFLNAHGLVREALEASCVSQACTLITTQLEVRAQQISCCWGATKKERTDAARPAQGGGAGSWPRTGAALDEPGSRTA